MNKHTPAPWKAYDDDGTGTLPCVISETVTKSGNFYVAQCNVFEDARLISAAPELLAALEALFEHCSMIHNSWGDNSNQKQADEAIATAKAAIARAKKGQVTT